MDDDELCGTVSTLFSPTRLFTRVSMLDLSASALPFVYKTIVRSLFQFSVKSHLLHSRSTFVLFLSLLSVCVAPGVSASWLLTRLFCWTLPNRFALGYNQIYISHFLLFMFSKFEILNTLHDFSWEKARFRVGDVD